MAELNLLAGKRAKTSTAYGSALNYFISGAALLADDGWEHNHGLAFALELNRAECEFLTGQLAAAEERLAILSSHTANAVELAAVACLRMDLYTTLDQSDRAVAVCLDYLATSGIDWSPHPTEEEARREYERIWSELGSRTIEELHRSALDERPGVHRHPGCSHQGLLAGICLRMRIWLHWPSAGRLTSASSDGNCDGSCFAYVWLGMIAGPRFGDYEAGFRFGRLGYELVEKRGLKRFEARTYLCFGHLVMPWTKHVRAGRDLPRRAFEAANRDR